MRVTGIIAKYYAGWGLSRQIFAVTVEHRLATGEMACDLLACSAWGAGQAPKSNSGNRWKIAQHDWHLSGHRPERKHSEVRLRLLASFDPVTIIASVANPQAGAGPCFPLRRWLDD